MNFFTLFLSPLMSGKSQCVFIRRGFSENYPAHWVPPFLNQLSKVDIRPPWPVFGSGWYRPGQYWGTHYCLSTATELRSPGLLHSSRTGMAPASYNALYGCSVQCTHFAVALSFPTAFNYKSFTRANPKSHWRIRRPPNLYQNLYQVIFLTTCRYMLKIECAEDGKHQPLRLLTHHWHRFSEWILLSVDVLCKKWLAV